VAVKCKTLKTPSWLRFLVNLKITVLVGLTFSLLILPWAFLGRLGLGGGGAKVPAVNISSTIWCIYETFTTSGWYALFKYIMTLMLSWQKIMTSLIEKNFFRSFKMIFLMLIFSCFADKKVVYQKNSFSLFLLYCNYYN
jgi:predicted membrane-bound spermidine synthase